MAKLTISHIKISTFFQRLPLLYLLTCVMYFTACQSTHDMSDQTLRLNIAIEPPMLDPRQTTDATSCNVLMMIGEGLVRLDDELQPQPAGAKKIEISSDQLTYTFTLRQTFWSNGDPVTATDYANSWLDQLDPTFPSSFAYKFFPIKGALSAKKAEIPLSEVGIKVLDTKTLQVTLADPTPYFLGLLATPPFFPVNQKAIVDHPNWAAKADAHFTTNGPFFLQTWDHDHEMVLLKNPYYWDQKNVFLEQVRLLMVEDSQTELYLFEQGQLDWCGSPLTSILAENLPQLRNLPTFHESPSLSVYFLTLNTTLPVLNNVKIRQALSYGIQRQALVEHILQANQIPAYSFVPSMPQYPAKACFTPPSNEKIIQLFYEGLQELNLSIDKLPKITVLYNTSRQHAQLMQAIVEHWTKLFPMQLSIDACDWKSFLAKVSHLDYQIARFGWSGDFLDPLAFLELFQYNEQSLSGGINPTGWTDPQYTALLELAKKQTQLKQRRHLLQQAELLLMQQMPVIPICFLTQNYLIQPWCKDILVLPTGLMDIKQARITKA